MKNNLQLQTLLSKNMLQKLLLIVTFIVTSPSHSADIDSVLEHYADLAHVMYSDALASALILQQHVEAFIAEPNEDSLAQAQQAWINARVPYMQTEAYRFGNSVVDDWEGKVNAWPLDEGLIDYTDPSYGNESEENPFYTANIIANEKLLIAGQSVDASRIDKQLLAETLHEIDGVEANVATGYHAVEFLLWGQDLNGTGAGAGSRPASDFSSSNCTGGNCQRRAAYLSAVTSLLVDDLQWIVNQWTQEGSARSAVIEGDRQENLARIFYGIGSLAYGELAGERMKLGLLLHDPEEEHDCFSDNTHWSHYYNALGIRNVYTGTYTKVNGEHISGPSIADLVAASDAEANKNLLTQMDVVLASMQTLVDTAKAGEAYDQMLAAGNTQGNQKIRTAVDALVSLTKTIENSMGSLQLDKIGFEGSDSLDNPNSIVN